MHLPRKERGLVNSAVLPAIAVLLLWCAYWLDVVFDLEFYRLGIFPRIAKGLSGVVAAPFIHGDLDHLLNNSIPLFVLGWGLMYFFPRLAGRVLIGSWLVSGLCVWVSARSSYHIGASGVVYGLAAFLFTSGILRRQRTLMGLALLVVFLYGGLLWGMFPIFPHISWESHFWGGAAGVIMAFIYRHVPSAVNDPRPIVWDDEEDEPNDDKALHPMTNDEDEHGTRTWRSTDTWNIGPPK
ncbi:MAG: rhomboid family intramembrane serine protease [Flavobacteriales bacterium]|nr:rhomboid family intramembrane serine protease [Flavobacteriales bacterium]